MDKVNNLKLILFFSISFFLCLVVCTDALQQVAGSLVISVTPGSDGLAQYGLMNDGNEIITVNLTSDGEVSKYLSFPKNVELTPNKIAYINITGKIPADYDLSLGKNITGFVYALQEGESGQVKINIQLKKSVTIEVFGESKEGSNQKSLMTGLVSQLSVNPIVVVLVVALVVIVFILIKIKKRGGEKK